MDADGVHPSEADIRHQHLGEHLDHRADRPRRVECCASPPVPISAHRASSPARQLAFLQHPSSPAAGADQLHQHNYQGRMPTGATEQ